MYLAAFILLVVSGTFYWAGKSAAHGNYWADRICAEAPGLCTNQSWLLACAAIAIFAGLILRLMKERR